MDVVSDGQQILRVLAVMLDVSARTNVEDIPSRCTHQAAPLLPVAPLEFQGPVSERSGRLNDTVPAMANGACWPGAVSCDGRT